MDMDVEKQPVTLNLGNSGKVGIYYNHGKHGCSGGGGGGDAAWLLTDVIGIDRISQKGLGRGLHALILCVILCM
jgi:hypothetical protein